MDNPDWMYDGALFDDVNIAVNNFVAADDAAFYLTTSDPCMQLDGSSVDASSSKDPGCHKRVRLDSKTVPVPKAHREKMRRDRMNDRFAELGSILEPGKPPRSDKASILSDAICMVTQLRSEAQKLKDSNDCLKVKIEELKAEKNDLRDEKQRLKVEKENLEQQVKMMNSRPTFVPHPTTIPAAFAAQGHQAGNHKFMLPFMGYPAYPGFPMWQFMPPADTDTSQDAEACPPVA